jgi:phosphatidylglycerophosphate synthase
VANFITVSRLPLLIVYVLMLFYGSPLVQLISIPLLFIFVMMDSLDGMIARRTGTTSLIGSVLDIAADRIYELVIWVCLAHLGVIPVAIPLIVIMRTSLTDALRTIGVSQGLAPFKQHKTKLGKFLVGSSWMRSGYSVSKISAWLGLTLGIALSGYPAGSSASILAPKILSAFEIIAWIAAVICVIRGLPVIIGTIRRAAEAQGTEA